MPIKHIVVRAGVVAPVLGAARAAELLRALPQRARAPDVRGPVRLATVANR